MKLLRAQVGSTSLVLVFNVPRMETESMRLEGVIYTVSETNLLRAAFGTGMGAGKPTTTTTRPEAAAAAPAPSPTMVVVDDYDMPPPPPPPADEEEQGLLPPPPPPPSDESNLAPSSLPPPQNTEVDEEGEPSSFAKQLQEAKLRKTPPQPRKNVVGGGGGGGLVSALEQRRMFIKPDEENNEDDDDEFAQETRSQPNPILYSLSGLAGTGTTLSLECDASNLAHVTGLAMALDYRTALGDKTLESLEHVTALIQQHGRALAAAASTGKEVDVSIPVSTAIYTALDTLNQQYS
jgi:hypothetical protein